MILKRCSLWNHVQFGFQ